MNLPEGYRLSRADPDVWTLYGPGGSVVARFVAFGVTDEEIERAAAEDAATGEEG